MDISGVVYHGVLYGMKPESVAVIVAAVGLVMFVLGYWKGRG